MLLAMMTMLRRRCALLALPHVHGRASAALREVIVPAQPACLPAAAVALHVQAALQVSLLAAVAAGLPAAALALGHGGALAEVGRLLNVGRRLLRCCDLLLKQVQVLALPHVHGRASAALREVVVPAQPACLPAAA